MTTVLGFLFLVIGLIFMGLGLTAYLWLWLSDKGFMGLSAPFWRPMAGSPAWR